MKPAYHPYRSDRNVHDPRALATILQKAETYLAEHHHPDRYIRKFIRRPLSKSNSDIFFRISSSSVDARWHQVVSSLCNVVLALFLTSALSRERNAPVRSNHSLHFGGALTLLLVSLPLSQYLITKLMVTIEYLCHSNQSPPFPFLCPSRELQWLRSKAHSISGRAYNSNRSQVIDSS